ncbi:uncharacterized protein BP01DRAFT_103193 [Aspergillus saccharolyticus JOP 1030-1]|uniref:Secreted protein n=1 Tax=Aspergillus saccharolyticus JOP 1030-1 TaxID=1450539 RepID=A0A318ZTH1_9EURO|nr:hypothetical protein BP01DRAFT_103193 [Aspergillus saccharolyticus JOP 1030-1]PYH43378.1 hypothetical protein BP01DRAFT_103193 [Aspergillus saccharolyticus JOP 1030-1]
MCGDRQLPYHPFARLALLLNAASLWLHRGLPLALPICHSVRNAVASPNRRLYRSSFDNDTALYLSAFSDESLPHPRFTNDHATSF